MKIVSILISALVMFSATTSKLMAFDSSDIKPDTDTVIEGGGGGTSLLDTLLSFVADSIFGLLALIAIGMFLFI